MKTARRSNGSRRVANAGVLLAALAALVIGACSGPPSYEPSPKDWDEGGDEADAAAQQRGSLDDSGSGDSDSGDGDSSDSDSGDSGESGSDLCATLDVATVQQAFGLSVEPSATAGEETAGLEDLTVSGGCAYEWSDGEVSGSLTVTAGEVQSSDDSSTLVESQASAAELSGEPVEGFGEASVLDTSGAVVADSAVAIGASDADGDGTKTVVVLVGPLDADSAAYGEVGSAVFDAYQ